ncbi:MAG: carboxypeptidase-like regulatory domain-containing protein [Planctomycetota bacterium]
MHRQLWFWLLLVGAAFIGGWVLHPPGEQRPGDPSVPVVEDSEASTERTAPHSDPSIALSADGPEVLPRWVWGRVVDAAGEAIADAEVSLWVDAGPFRDSRVAVVARTDADGRYELRGRAEPEDRYAAMSVRKPGYQVAEPDRVRLMHAGWYDTDCGILDYEFAIDLDEEDRSGIPDVRDARSIGGRPAIVLVPGRRVEGRLTLSAGTEGSTLTADVARGAWVRGLRDSIGWPVDSDGRFVAWVHPQDRTVGAVLRDGRWGRAKIAAIPEESSLGESDDGASEPPPPDATQLAAFAVTDLEVELGATLRRHRVVGVDGPIADARVWVRPEGSSWLATERVTDQEGAVEVAAGAAVSVVHPEYLQAYFYRDEVLEELPMESGRWLTLRFDPAVTPATVRGEHSSVYFDRTGDSFRSRPTGANAAGSDLEVDGFLPEFIAWPGGKGPHDLGRVELDRGVWVDVRVVDERGRAVPKATLATGHLHTSTDTAGRARFGPLHSTLVEFDVYADGYASRSVVTTAETEGDELLVTLSAPATLSLRIVDQSGRPVDGANLSQSGEWNIYGASDAEGRVERLVVDAGEPIGLAISHDAHRTARLRVEPIAAGENRDLGVVSLFRLPSVEVRVVDPDGGPARRVDVELRLRTSIFGREATTDDDGVAELFGVEPGAYHLSIEPEEEDGAPYFEGVNVPDGLETVRLEVTLPPSREVLLRVVDAGGEPLEGIEVEWIHRSGFITRYDFTDVDGDVRVVGVCDGPCVLRLADDHRELQTPFESLDDLPEQVVFARSPILSVLIANMNDELENDELELLIDGIPVATATIERGRATFGIGAGQEDVRFRSENQYESSAYRVSIPDDGSEVEINIELLPPIGRQPLNLHVVDGRGCPLRFANILVDGEWWGETDELGRFNVLLDPATRVLSISFSGVEVTVLENPLEHEDPDGNVVITVGPLGLVRVFLEQAGESISLTSGVRLSLRPENDLTGDARTSLESAESGTWAQCSVRAGEWILEVSWLGLDVGRYPVSVRAGEVVDRTIGLPPGIEIHGRLMGAQPSGVCHWHSHEGPMLWLEMAVEADGSFRGSLPSPGSYWVSTEGRTRSVVVDGPGRVDVDFSGGVEGRVVGLTDGDPQRPLLYLFSNSGIVKSELDHQGRFSLPRVEPGLCRWRLHDFSGWTRNGTVEVGRLGEEIEIAVPKVISTTEFTFEPRLGQRIGYAEWKGGNWVQAGAGRSGEKVLSSDARYWFVFDLAHGRFATLNPKAGPANVNVEFEPGGFLTLSNELQVDFWDFAVVELEPLSGSFPEPVRLYIEGKVLPVGSYRIRAGGSSPWETIIDIRAGETTVIETVTFR